MREYRIGNKQRIKFLNIRLRRRRRLFAISYLGGKCKDCGINDTRVLEFDHVSGKKIANVAWFLTRSNPGLIEELSKCELVCANCHSIREYKRNDNNQHMIELADQSPAPIFGHKSALTREQRDLVRHKFFNEKNSQTTIAKEFSVSISLINNIVRRRTFINDLNGKTKPGLSDGSYFCRVPIRL